MGLFDIFKKKETKNKNGELLLAMPLFKNGDTYSLQKIVTHLQDFWGLKVTDVYGDDGNATLSIEGELVGLAHMPAPIPGDDIEGTLQYAYNWPTAKQDLENYDSHAIVSVLPGNKSPLEQFRLLSKLLISLLTTSNAVGIYQGSQTLLIPREDYLESTEALKNGEVPLMLWIYIGIRKSEEGNSLYTYGLEYFGKKEMEIIHSKAEISVLFDLMVNIASYVIGSNVTFRSGETLGYTAEQKIKITASEGQLVDGISLKLDI
jgi:hypothetical protein